tara:strand:- start:496 stop:699 length:204 start_codon:yes stop_codon:yes gene_type:complete
MESKMIDKILLLLLGICIVLMSIVTLADPDGYYMQSIEGIFFTLIIGSLGLTMVLLALSKMVFNKTE